MPLLLRGPDHRLGVGVGRGHRLLDQYVDAPPQQVDRARGVMGRGERRPGRYQPPALVMKSVRKRSCSEVGSGFTADRMDRLSKRS